MLQRGERGTASMVYMTALPPLSRLQAKLRVYLQERATVEDPKDAKLPTFDPMERPFVPGHPDEQRPHRAHAHGAARRVRAFGESPRTHTDGPVERGGVGNKGPDTFRRRGHIPAPGVVKPSTRHMAVAVNGPELEASLWLVTEGSRGPSFLDLRQGLPLSDQDSLRR